MLQFFSSFKIDEDSVQAERTKIFSTLRRNGGPGLSIQQHRVLNALNFINTLYLAGAGFVVTEPEFLSAFDEFKEEGRITSVSEHWIPENMEPGLLHKELSLSEGESLDTERVESELVKLYKRSAAGGGPGLSVKDIKLLRGLAAAKELKRNMKERSSDIMAIEAIAAEDKLLKTKKGPLEIKAGQAVAVYPASYLATNGGAAESIVNFDNDGSINIRSADDKYDSETHMFQHMIEITAKLSLGDSFGDIDHDAVVAGLSEDIVKALETAGARQESGPAAKGKGKDAETVTEELAPDETVTEETAESSVADEFVFDEYSYPDLEVDAEAIAVVEELMDKEEKTYSAKDSQTEVVDEEKKGKCGGTPSGSQGGPQDGSGPGNEEEDASMIDDILSESSDSYFEPMIDTALEVFAGRAKGYGIAFDKALGKFEKTSDGLFYDYRSDGFSVSIAVDKEGEGSLQTWISTKKDDGSSSLNSKSSSISVDNQRDVSDLLTAHLVEARK